MSENSLWQRPFPWLTDERAWLHGQLSQARQPRNINGDLMAQAKGFKQGLNRAEAQCTLLGAQLQEAQQQVRGQLYVLHLQTWWLSQQL